MSINDINSNNNINIAVHTADEKVLETLSKSFNWKVRRAVARNTSTPQEVIDSLVFDPSFNVSYIANKRCTNPREEFNESNNPCVCCVKCETTYRIECLRCGSDSYSRILKGESFDK